MFFGSFVVICVVEGVVAAAEDGRAVVGAEVGHS